jgi:hypothetical protein
LQSWLGLASGPWPPDHYTLLGLPYGSCDPALVEPRVLDRMAKLRPHQLLHPELVTVGMNRLAQALVCLTDPSARTAYDAEIGIPMVQSDAVGSNAQATRPVPPPLPTPTFEVVSAFPLGNEDDAAPSDVTQVLEVPFTAGLAPPVPIVLPYVVVEPQPPLPAFEVVAEPAVEAGIVLPVVLDWQPASRRELYARLTVLRRVMGGWQKLKPALADPQEQLNRPLSALHFLEAVVELRPLLHSRFPLVGQSGRPGGIVAALLCQPPSLHTFRSLLPDQRRVVAQDWLAGEAELQREHRRLRELSRWGRRRRPRLRRRNWFTRTLAWAIRTPESLLLVVGLAIMLAAGIRAWRGH